MSFIHRWLCALGFHESYWRTGEYRNPKIGTRVRRAICVRCGMVVKEKVV